jgi:hypothetical protein
VHYRDHRGPFNTQLIYRIRLALGPSKDQHTGSTGTGSGVRWLFVVIRAILLGCFLRWTAGMVPQRPYLKPMLFRASAVERWWHNASVVGTVGPLPSGCPALSLGQIVGLAGPVHDAEGIKRSRCSGKAELSIPGSFSR